MIDFENDGGLSQEEMSYSLDRAKEGMESSYRNFNTKKLMNKNKNEIARKKVINQVFDKMEELGLDPSDQEALSSFMAKAKESHPEMVKVIEEALNALLEGAEEQPSAPMGQEQMAPEGMPGGIPPEMGGGMPSGMPPEMGGGMPGGVLPQRPGGAPEGMPPEMQGLLG